MTNANWRKEQVKSQLIRAFNEASQLRDEVRDAKGTMSVSYIAADTLVTVIEDAIEELSLV